MICLAADSFYFERLKYGTWFLLNPSMKELFMFKKNNGINSYLVNASIAKLGIALYSYDIWLVHGL